VQKRSPESRRFGVIEAVDADPRRFRDPPGAPWPVRRGGLWLRLYERSLGLAFLLLFAASWIGHLFGGWRDYRADQLAHGHPAPALGVYLTSARFWFESFQNWQSECLAIAAMVWLSVYAPHDENERHCSTWRSGLTNDRRSCAPRLAKGGLRPGARRIQRDFIDHGVTRGSLHPATAQPAGCSR
jgi:hypothetical protein